MGYMVRHMLTFSDTFGAYICTEKGRTEKGNVEWKGVLTASTAECCIDRRGQSGTEIPRLTPGCFHVHTEIGMESTGKFRELC